MPTQAGTRLKKGRKKLCARVVDPLTSPSTLHAAAAPETAQEQPGTLYWQACDPASLSSSQLSSLPASHSDSDESEPEDRQPADPRKRKMLTDLTPEQEQEMIDWLRAHPVLWNKKKKDYKNKSLKEALWADQAKRLKKDVKLIQVWYKSVRTRYGRLKKLPSDSASERTERDQWVVTNFEFLRPFIAEVTKRMSTRTKLDAAAIGVPPQMETLIPEEDQEPRVFLAEPEDAPAPVAAAPTSIQSTQFKTDETSSMTHNQLILVHQELLERLKRSQPIAERDSFAEWLRTSMQGLDGHLFRKCQLELTQVMHKFQELRDQQHQQPSSAQWPTNVQNPVWGSQDGTWVQQQYQPTQQVTPRPATSPQHGGSDSIPSLNISGVSQLTGMSGQMPQMLHNLDAQQSVSVTRDLDTPVPSKKIRLQEVKEEEDTDG